MLGTKGGLILKSGVIFPKELFPPEDSLEFLISERKKGPAGGTLKGKFASFFDLLPVSNFFFSM